MEKEQILKNYPDYTVMGCVNYQQKAFDAYRASNKHEAIKIGRCFELVLLHDLKQAVEIDFGD